MQAAQRSPVKKIIVVDDSPILLEATRGVLEDAGYDAVALENPLLLPAMVRKENPDLIVLDLNMPAIRGDDVAAIITRLGVDVSRRVILYSDARDLPEVADKAGVGGWVSKASPEEDLLGCIKALLGKGAKPA